MDDKLDLLDETYEEDNIDNMYLTFRVADEDYAVGIAYVIEIVGIQKFKRVPDVPEFIKGVINLRGKVIPIMDVRLRFGLPEKEYNDRTCIIVLEVDDVPTGIVVDEVSEVLEIPAEQISPPPAWQGASDKGVILGMGKLENTVCAILDVSKFLFEQEIVLPEKFLEAENKEAA